MSLTHRFIVSVALLCVAGWFAVVKPVLERVQRQYLEAAEEPLVDMANLLAEMVGDVGVLEGALERTKGRNFEAVIYEVKKTAVDIEIAVTDGKGVVLYDSMNPRRVGKIHGLREVRLTLEGKYGARTSLANPGDPLSAVMYVAAPVLDEEGKIVGVVSVGKPQRNLLIFIEQTRKQVKAFAITGVVAALALTGLLSRWIAEPLRKLTQHAEAVAGGERRAAPSLPGRHLKRLGEMMEGMRDALEGKAHVETYVRNLTHEMKSPVAAIRGAAELLNGNPTEEQRNTLLANIDSESARLEALGDQLMALANLESRKQLDDADDFDLAELVRRTMDAKKTIAASHGIRMDMEAEQGVVVRGEPRLIELAIGNLLQNAIDFSEDDSRIIVRVWKEGRDAFVEVEDEGEGLPEYASVRAFERFFSMPRKRTGRKSSGLGLCFVRETAELHGGEVRLMPGEVKGVRARLRI